MKEEVNQKLEANHRSQLLLLYHLRGLAAHLASSYPFPSQEEVLVAIGWPTLLGDQSSEGQKGDETVNGIRARAGDVAKVATTIAINDEV